MFGLIGTGVGLGLSLWGENQRKNQQRDARNRKIDAYTEAKYTSGEKEKVLAGIERKYNTANLGEANSAALGVNSVLNSDTLRGMNSSKLLGRRTDALVETETGIDAHNKQMNAAIAGVEDIEPTNIGNVITGGVLGYQGGEALEKLDLFSNPDSSITNVNQTTQSGNYRGTGADLDGANLDISLSKNDNVGIIDAYVRAGMDGETAWNSNVQNAIGKATKFIDGEEFEFTGTTWQPVKKKTVKSTNQWLENFGNTDNNYTRRFGKVY